MGYYERFEFYGEFRSTGIHEPWLSRRFQFHRWIGIESAAVVVEIMLFGLSIYLIWGLHMASILRVMILLAFASRLL